MAIWIFSCRFGRNFILRSQWHSKSEATSFQVLLSLNVFLSSALAFAWLLFNNTYG